MEQLQKRQMEILKIEELSWKLKSRITLLKEGDLNTKFFHRIANDRRNKNAIWSITKDDGNVIYDEAEI